jgi:surface polysaccharide O-acyltransferase-like enzyme
VFAAGAALAAERRLEEAIRRGAGLALAGGIVSTAGVGVLVLLNGYRPVHQAARDAAYAALWALMVWSWLLVFLYVGMRWLDFANRVTAYLSESILPFYVLHHPVVVFVASVVIGLGLNVWASFALVAGISMAVTLALYEALVRRWALTRFVFGLKPVRGGGPSGRAPSASARRPRAPARRALRPGDPAPAVPPSADGPGSPGSTAASAG